ncbi:MAG: hypothetical protein ACOCYT_02705 [Chloroflexota bacterium]
MSSPELMNAFDFTPEELRINQAGQLSARQQAVVAQQDFQQTIDLGCALIVFALIGAFLFAGCALLFNIEAIFASLRNLMPFILVGGGGLVIAVLVVNWMGVRERARSGRPDVAMIEGTIDLRQSDGGFNARQYMVIDDKEFRIQGEMYDALQTYAPGTLFRVYYAWRVDRVMSVEAESDYLDRPDSSAALTDGDPQM